MNEEIIKQVEQLMEFGYGDTLRLDSIVDALRNGRSLYSSDQKYVDMLVSKYLYPHEEPVEELKMQTKSLEQKIKNTKEEYHGKKTAAQENVFINSCNECGSIVPRMYNFCPKCGSVQGENQSRKMETSSRGIRSYQILSLIGGILGIITIFIAGTAVQLLSIVLNSFGTATPEKGELMSQVWISLFLYMVSIIIPFAVKNTKAVGTILIILSFATMVSAGGFGIIGFIFLLTAGIVSLAWKRRLNLN